MKKARISHLVSVVKGLPFKPVTKRIWQGIQDEGLDEENDCFDRSDWLYATLPISAEEKIGLMKTSEDVVNGFNLFDIKLKSEYDMRVIDLIDYDNGSVYLVRLKS